MKYDITIQVIFDDDEFVTFVRTVSADTELIAVHLLVNYIEVKYAKEIVDFEVMAIDRVESPKELH